MAAPACGIVELQAVATVARGLLPFATGEVLSVGGGLHLHRV